MLGLPDSLHPPRARFGLRLACAALLAAALAADAGAATAAVDPALAGDCAAPSIAARSPGPTDPPCLAAGAAEPAPRLAQSAWLLPPGSTAREPPAGAILATVCLGWLVLLAIASVVRPRGWHHRPLFGRRAPA